VVFNLAKEQDWVLWELRESEAKLQDVFRAMTLGREDADAAESESGSSAEPETESGTGSA